MPRYTSPRDTGSSLSVDGPAIVAWVVLVAAVAGPGGLLTLEGWSAAPLAGGLCLGALTTWAGLRVLIQIRDHAQ